MSSGQRRRIQRSGGGDDREIEFCVLLLHILTMRFLGHEHGFPGSIAYVQENTPSSVSGATTSGEFNKCDAFAPFAQCLISYCR